MHSFNFWWRLLRPHTLTASFVPVIIGSVYALGFTEHFRFSLFLAMLIASMAIQAGTNLFNEYYDYKRGLDTAESVGIAGAIVHDGASPRFVLNCALACYILAALLGIYICAHSSWLLILIGAFCMLVGYLYTGGPYPISASPFGEVFAGGFLGTGVICISFFFADAYRYLAMRAYLCAHAYFNRLDFDFQQSPRPRRRRTKRTKNVSHFTGAPKKRQIHDRNARRLLLLAVSADAHHPHVSGSDALSFQHYTGDESGQNFHPRKPNTSPNDARYEVYRPNKYRLRLALCGRTFY